jgi:hypothetical protein
MPFFSVKDWAPSKRIQLNLIQVPVGESAPWNYYLNKLKKINYIIF